MFFDLEYYRSPCAFERYLPYRGLPFLLDYPDLAATDLRRLGFLPVDLILHFTALLIVILFYSHKQLVLWLSHFYSCCWYLPILIVDIFGWLFVMFASLNAVETNFYISFIEIVFLDLDIASSETCFNFHVLYDEISTDHTFFHLNLI